MKKILFVLLLCPTMMFAQWQNASKQILSIYDAGESLKLIHIDSAMTIIPKLSIGFMVTYSPPSKSVQIPVISGGSNNYTFGFQYQQLTYPVFASQYEACDTLNAWIARR
jgi:hypothetical protein